MNVLISVGEAPETSSEPTSPGRRQSPSSVSAVSFTTPFFATQKTVWEYIDRLIGMGKFLSWSGNTFAQ